MSHRRIFFRKGVSGTPYVWQDTTCVTCNETKIVIDRDPNKKAKTGFLFDLDCWNQYVIDIVKVGPNIVGTSYVECDYVQEIPVPS